MKRKLEYGENGYYYNLMGSKTQVGSNSNNEVWVDENNFLILHLSYLDNGLKFYERHYKDGFSHNLDGPAYSIFRIDGMIVNYYYIEGKEYKTKRDWEIEVNRIEMLGEI